jgi:serine/threonine-protein kinase
MGNELRLLELVEEAFDSGLDPEECCAHSPELIGELRRRLEECELLRDELEAMFPPEVTKFEPPSDSLPSIPGYEINSILGRGGMGVVYKARHLKLNRSVAIKMLVGGPYSTSRELARLLREAEVEAALRHPNIVQIYDVDEFGGLPFFTMEYVEGGTLAEKLNGVPLTARDASNLLLTLAQAVDAAHRAEIIHRDLKPNNVLLCGDGTPKIADFGLARHFGRQGQNTLTCAMVGTPSYMAPEQAAGKPHVGPAADIYSLGAILYEMLTGRPPFRAETALETQRQVVSEEPVPPSRLNARVPRDLETICLKCLRKDPSHRYAAASALADDLERFSEGRPIRARPLWLGARVWRWSRRNPSSAALVVTAIIVLGATLSGGFWLQQQQANRRAQAALREGEQQQAMKAALDEAAKLEKQDRWPEARAVLESGLHVLDSGGQPSFGAPLRQAHTDAVLVTELEEVRLLLSEGKTESRGLTAPQLYANAFERYGLPVKKLAPAELAARIHESAIHDMIIAYLHDWLYWAPDKDCGPLRAVLDRADGDEWRRAYRDADAGLDTDKLLELANAPGAAAQPPLLLSGLAGRLSFMGKGAAIIEFLRDAQQHHADDFWINFLLATLLEAEQPREAVGYYRAAVAIRPSSDQAYVKLGRALNLIGSTDEGIAAFRIAIKLNPHSEAAKEMALTYSGRLEESRAAWAKRLELDPADHDSWNGYAELCLYLGREDDYRHARHDLLIRFGATTDPWIAERTSRACLLLPATGNELHQAVALAERATAVDRLQYAATYPWFLFAKGLAEYRQGRFEEAISIMRSDASSVLNPGPALIIAMALHQSEQTDEARETLASAILSYDWSEDQVRATQGCILHSLRREAERMILPNLPAFLEGKYQPRDNDERLAMLGACQFSNRTVAMAGLYAGAFVADPSLADDLEAGHRYNAARAAALAGCGHGEDATGLGQEDRKRWRDQARKWLQEELAARVRALDADPDAARAGVRQTLTRWRKDPDLAGVRDPGELDKLAADEQKDYLALWTGVATLFGRCQ